MRILIQLFVCGCCLFTGALNAQDKEPIAVMDLKPKGVDNVTASILSDELRTELFASGKYSVLNREDMKAILGEHAFQQSGMCDDTKCMANIGGALGVVFMVTGSIGKLGDTYSITLKMIDIERIESVNIVNERYSGKEDGLLVSIQNAGRKLLGQKLNDLPVQVDNSAYEELKKRFKQKMNEQPVTQRLLVACKPKGAEVFINGIDRGQSPVLINNLPAGEYSIKLVKRDFHDYTGRFKIKADQKDYLYTPELKAKWTGRRIFHYSLGAFLVANLVGGIIISYY